MTECPELAVFEDRAGALPPEIAGHVETCESCRAVVALFELRADAERCVHFEPLIAARSDGSIGRAARNLLERHLASCAECRLVAETLGSATAGDVDDLPTLPQVDPAAYALGLEVGRGGMGRVLAARDLRVGRPVAVKELLGRSRGLAARFEREARVTARLQHPGIVPIYEIGRWPDGTPFYSMRMVEGRTLRDSLADAGTLAARLRFLPAVIAATGAIAFAHAQRVIHRDITPSNVLVGAYGETVVIDWGLAKDFGDATPEDDAGPYRGDAGSELTGVGAVIGTAAYMPPEQANAQPVDERADVYALGAILYHLLAGRPPYGSTTARKSDQLLRLVKAGPPPPITDLVAAAPRDLVSIVDKAMARDPNERYPSARELAEELARYHAGRMVEAHEYSTAERMRRFIARNRAPLFVTGLAAIALATIGTIAVSRVVASRNAASRTVTALLEEEGRVELLAGNRLHALAYLDAARERGSVAPSLAFMFASALRDFARADDLLDCGGGDPRSIAFTPDGTTMVAACFDVAKAWRLADHAPIATYGPFHGGFTDAKYSHDGKTLATWGEDGVARLWDVATSTLRRSFVHGAPVTFVTFTPDDKTIATSGWDGWARIWNAETGALLHEIEGTDAIMFRHLYGLLSADGKRLLTVTLSGAGVGWDVATGNRLGGFQHGDGFVLGGELSRDDRAVTCGTDRLVKVWNASTGALVWQLAGATNVVWKCVFSSDGTRVLGADHDGHAIAWDVRTGATITTIEHGNPIWTARFAPDGERFLTMSGVDGVIKIWETSTGALLSTHDSLGGREARFTPDGRSIVAARGDGRLRVVGLGGPLRMSWHDERETIVAIAAGGARVVVAPSDGRLRLVDTATSRSVVTPEIHEPAAANETRVVAMSTTGVIVLDAETGATIATLPIDHPVELATSGDGTHVAAMFSDRAPEVWQVAGGDKVATLDGKRAILDEHGRHAITWGDAPPRVWTIGGAATNLPITGAYRPIGFALDGERVVIESDPDNPSHVITVWNTSGGPALFTIADVVSAPAIDPSGAYLTTIGLDRGVSTLTITTGETTVFTGEQLQDAQIDPTRNLVAGVTKQGDAVVVLDAHAGRPLARWPIAHDPPAISENGFDAPHATVRWTRDGRTLVSRSSRLAVWHADRDVPADADVLVRRNVPFRVGKTGQLEPRFASLHVTLTRDGAPLVGVRLVAEYRKPAALGSEPLMWSRTSTARHDVVVISDERGGVHRDGLDPGVYDLTFVVDGRTYRTQRELDLDDLALDIARLPASVRVE